ncbi:MAG: Rrf2 family transcriptional regulator [Armatimonadota bacterium]|nr:Rrf2 family transcriptional regulator [Armatimonadota bacterium]
MILSHKCQYAIRAMYEITRREGEWPVKSGEIAKAQAIPPRFLENILAQLRRGGFVDSKRGKNGGYMLADPTQPVTVGEVIRFIEGPLVPVHCMMEGSAVCELYGECPFREMWTAAHQAVIEVYDNTTVHGLIAAHAAKQD